MLILTLGPESEAFVLHMNEVEINGSEVYYCTRTQTNLTF